MLFTSLLESDAESTAIDAPVFVPLAGCACSSCGGAGAAAPQFAPAPGTATLLATNATLAPTGSGAAALMSGSSWTGGPMQGERTVITFSFSHAGSWYSQESGAFRMSLMEFSAADKAATRALLARIEDVCNVRFVEVADSGASVGDVRYAYSQEPNNLGYAGFAYFPAAGSGGDVWIGSAQASAQWDFYRGNLILHETLHAIGLKHPFDAGVRLDSASDIIPNTVMSYSAMAGSQSGYLSSYPIEPMALDITALQAIYGAAWTHTGNDHYDLSSAAFQSGFHALWDAGGWDTLDASRLSHGVTMDLREGGHSDIGVRVNAYSYFGAVTPANLRSTVYTNTLTIANGTRIESAIGSAGDDIFITGNATRLIDGGAGVDVAVFAGTIGNYSIHNGGGQYRVTHLADGATTDLIGVERIEFSDINLRGTTESDAARLDQAYAQAFRLYNAALDRVPDQGGIVFQTHALQTGHSLFDLAGNFMASPEFQSRFSVPGDDHFVNLLYQNVLDRAPDAAGMAYHVGRLADGVNRADILIGFSESPENQAATAATLVGMSAAGMLIPV